jgi:hypothetical protein
MDYQALQTSFGTGIGYGLAVMVTTTAILLPASYVLNQFIYHAWPMRILLAILSILFFFISAPILLVRFILGLSKPIHYFGLLPIITQPPPSITGWWASLFSLFRLFAGPFYHYNDQGGTDTEGYNQAIQHLLVPADTAPNAVGSFQIRPDAVCEPLFDKIQETGTMSDYAVWSAAVTDLSEPCKAQFSSG